LVWARTSIALDLQSASQQIGISETELSEWESGEKRPTIAQLREAARVYRRPLAAFFLSEPPTDFLVPHDFRRHPRGTPRKTSRDLISEIRRIPYLREVAYECAEFISDEPTRFLGMATLNSDIDALAESARALLQVPLARQKQDWNDSYAALRGWRAALEEIGILVFQFRGVEISELRGFSVRDIQFPVIAVNASDAPNARIFTLQHEFAHLLLNTAGMCDLVPAERTNHPDQAVEAFCNAFAATLLVPRQAILGSIGVTAFSRPRDWTDEQISRLAREFCVSSEVIARRLSALGGASREFYLKKRTEYQMRAEATRDKVSFGPTPATKALWSVGQEFTRIAFDAYDRDAISASDLSEFLGVKTKHFAEIRQMAFESRPAGAGA
jgi:Zn-dependent peptidase ImmA (M78 family)